ncbi:MAG: helix-turn-helix transcriptional regulator [Planctomycetes bacterium]|nr:helix-turn-helix transcriptional regulator [Planctomycetota bacterium]
MDAEAVIAAFERLHGVSVCLHDVGGRFVGRLDERRRRHDHRLCKAAKASGQERICARFDAAVLRDTAMHRPDGFAKVCHAGLVELVVPQIEHGVLSWVLFAGVWADPGLPDAVRDRRSPVRLQPAPALPAGWPDLLDALRSLAARLSLSAPPPLPAPTSRQEAVVGFLRLNHHRDIGLGDLARELGLSPSRTSHLVAALFGRPFARLLAETRLASAQELLRCTELPVADVAMRAGYGDLSHFHAAFRAATAATPAVWRRSGRQI